MTTPIYAINIRRDAHTITPVTVPEYEIPILQEMFGIENIQNENGKRIDEHGLGEKDGDLQAGDDEYSRLCAKYGTEMIEQVYGKKASKGLDNAIAASKEDAALTKATKKAEADKAKEDAAAAKKAEAKAEADKAKV